MSAAAGNESRLAEHERLVAALLRDPAAFETPAAERSLITTAISSLVVAGDEVLKLRKPLALDFLDFSTPELRRTDCEEELRLNRRTAPQVYLDVLPVTGSVDAPHVGGAPADAIDWALRMRRFDDTQRLDRLADQRRLTEPLIDALARAVARFHMALPSSPSAFGSAQAVRHWALGNFDVLQTGPAARTHGARLQTLRDWTEAEFARIAPRLTARHAEGFVRECHGDLHLGNIVLEAGVPMPFDCLEFNSELRHIDVMADLAFLFMDLVRHGLHAFAWRLVNAYAEHSGDYAGLATLRFFAVYRAMVRAKVALIRADQHDGEAWAAFERDLTLAESLAAPRTGPQHCMLTCGVSGSGKSTLALGLAQMLGAVRVRSDVERKRLFGLPASVRPDTAQAAQLYSPAATERTYARLAELATTLLDAGLHVIVDAAFLRRTERDALRAQAAAHGAQVNLIECHAADAVLRDRVARRVAAADDASDADLAVLQRQLQWRERAADDEHPLRLDTAAAPDALLQQALRAMGIA